METIQNVLGGAHHGWSLREGAQEEQRLVEANQRSRIREARGVEAIQQLYDAGGLVATEAIAMGFKFGELVIESSPCHKDSRTRVPHGWPAWYARQTLRDSGL